MRDLDSLTYDEIRNIWTESMRKLDTMVWPVGASCPRLAIIDFFDSVQYEMFKRIEMKAKNDIKRNATRPDRVPSGPGRDPEGENPDFKSKDRGREEWRARVAMGRMHAMEGTSPNDARSPKAR